MEYGRVLVVLHLIQVLLRLSDHVSESVFLLLQRDYLSVQVVYQSLLLSHYLIMSCDGLSVIGSFSPELFYLVILLLDNGFVGLNLSLLLVILALQYPILFLQVTPLLSQTLHLLFHLTCPVLLFLLVLHVRQSHLLFLLPMTFP